MTTKKLDPQDLECAIELLQTAGLKSISKELQKIKKQQSKPRIKIASAKNKGRQLQNRVRQDIISNYGIDEKDIRTASGGQPGCDIILSAMARRKFPYAVEVKNVEKLNLRTAWEQAVSNAEKENLRPLLVSHSNHSEILVTLQWAHFLEIGKSVIEKGGEKP